MTSRGATHWNKSVPARSCLTARSSGLERSPVTWDGTATAAARWHVCQFRRRRFPAGPRTVRHSRTSCPVKRPSRWAPGQPRTVRSLAVPSTDSPGRPPSDAVYAVVLHTDGLSSLERIAVDGTVTVVRSNLDASPFFNSIAFSDDGRTVYLALASDAAPDVARRHDPEAAHRDLDIYSLDTRSNRLRALMHAAGDDCCPYVAAGGLYWTHNDPARGGRRVPDRRRRQCGSGRPRIPPAVESRRTSDRVHSRISPPRGLRTRHGRMGRWRRRVRHRDVSGQKLDRGIRRRHGTCVVARWTLGRVSLPPIRDRGSVSMNLRGGRTTRG